MDRLFTLKMLAVILVLGTSLIAGSAAKAQHHDVFNTNTPPPLTTTPHISGNAAFGKNSPPARWFDEIDAQVGSRLATFAEQAIMNKSFNGDVKRVTEWTNTASTVARRYKEIARILRAAPMPQGLTAAQNKDLKDYSSSWADWYEDFAAYLEDWIRPRPAAVTREQLSDQLDQMHKRSENLQQHFKTLLALDKQIRSEFDVRDRDDALARYVTRRPQ